LTWHGSDSVLNQSYPHRNKLIAAWDADFPHSGAKATSGVTVFLNGAPIAWKVRRQTTVSLNSTEAKVKASCPGVEMVRSVTDLWGEIMHAKHGCVRTMMDSQGAEANINHGMDTKKCASFKRAQFYAEDTTTCGLLWIDHVPGTLNPADILTKQVGTVGAFANLNGIMNGSAPHLYESAAVLEVLSDAKQNTKQK
jgi:hypothetical protein